VHPLEINVLRKMEMLYEGAGGGGGSETASSSSLRCGT